MAEIESSRTQEPSFDLQTDFGVAKKMFIPHLGESELRLAIVNLFDHTNLIRNGTGIGVFQPGYLQRRAFYGALTIPIPFI